MRKLTKRPINKDRTYGWMYVILGVLSILLGLTHVFVWDRDVASYIFGGIWILIGLSDFRVAHLYLTDDEKDEHVIVSAEYPVYLDGK